MRELPGEKIIKYIWRVICQECKTETTLDIGNHLIKRISTNKEIEFILKPEFICLKCMCVCIVKLVKLKEI